VRKYSVYPHCRASGAEWLGQVPSHWKIARLRFLLCERFANGLFKKAVFWGEGTRIINVTDLYVANDLVNEASLERLECSDDELKSYSTKHGDFFVVRSSLKLEGIGKSAALLSPTEDTVFECHTVRGRPNLEEIHPRFLNLFMNSADARYYFMTRSNVVTMATIDQEKIKNLVVVFPEYQEQQQIAAFLDWKTGQIDALIGKKKELLEKLKEKRIAVITQAVTQGLNPAAPMRDSGIPWLGQVPEHWEVPALKFRYTVELGKMLDEKRLTGEHSIHYLRNVDVQWDQINYENLPVMDIPPEEYSRYTIRAGDVLACEGGEVGRSAVVREQSGIIGFQKAIHRLRTDSDDELPTFVYYTLLWAVHTKVFSAEGSSTIAHLTADQLRRYRFPRPPRCEQEIIVAYLEGQVGRMNKLAAKIESAIDFLTEYRTALITAATTGKIDLRQVKIPACA